MKSTKKQSKLAKVMAAQANTVLVYDVATDEMREVTRAEAAAGMARYARTLGPGTPACGEVERQALQMLRGEQS